MPCYLVAQKALWESAFMRPARSPTSRARLVARPAGARHLRRLSEAAFLRSDFTTPRASRSRCLHVFALGAWSA